MLWTREAPASPRRWIEMHGRAAQVMAARTHWKSCSYHRRTDGREQGRNQGKYNMLRHTASDPLLPASPHILNNPQHICHQLRKKSTHSINLRGTLQSPTITGDTDIWPTAWSFSSLSHLRGPHCISFPHCFSTLCVCSRPGRLHPAPPPP